MKTYYGYESRSVYLDIGWFDRIDWTLFSLSVLDFTNGVYAILDIQILKFVFSFGLTI